MADLEELRALVALAKHGSITGAATELRTSRARMRRKLEALEERAATQLLARVGKKLIPTEAGTGLIQSAEQLLNEAALIIAHAREVGNEPTGILRVGLPPGFSYHLANFARRALFERYPTVRMEVRVTEDPLRLLPKEVDLVITVDEDRDVPDCARLSIVSLNWQLLASTEYLERRGRPTTPQDLQSHHLLRWRALSNPGEYLHLRGGGRLEVSPVLFSSDERFLLYLATQGEGIAYIPNTPFTNPEFPDLEPVLPEVVGRSINGNMYVSNVLRRVPRVKAVWDAALQVASYTSPDTQ